MWRVRVELRCSECGFTAREDALHLLRRAGMLKRAGDDVDEHLVIALLAAVGQRLACQQCGHTGVTCVAVDDEDDHDDWLSSGGQAQKQCKQCRQLIPVERLRLFPDNEYCAVCQEQREKAPLVSEQREFCPWCGEVLSHKSTRRRGLTEYVSACPACGFIG